MLFQNVDIEAGFNSFNCVAAMFDCVRFESGGDGVGVVGHHLAKKLGDICIFKRLLTHFIKIK